MHTYQLTIEGLSPLLIHAYNPDFGVEQKVEIKKKEKDYGTPREQVEKCLYLDKDGQVWVPTSWIKGALISCASDYKLPGSRKSLKSVIGGVFIPVQEKMYFDPPLYKQNIEIDSRPVAIQSSSSKIMRHRGRVENPWRLSCEVRIITKIVPAEQVLELLNDVGLRAGIGDFRPNRQGSFGQFQVVKWEKIKE